MTEEISAKTIALIETVSLRGDGKETILREVKQYWDFEGKLVAENDPCAGKDSAKDYEDRHPFGKEFQLDGIKVQTQEYDLIDHDTGFIPYLVVSALALSALIISGILTNCIRWHMMRSCKY